MTMMTTASSIRYAAARCAVGGCLHRSGVGVRCRFLVLRSSISSCTPTSHNRRHCLSTSSSTTNTRLLHSLWNPTEEHAALRETLRSFVETEVEPQADFYNKTEQFNVDLFRRLGSSSENRGIGILGLTVDEEYGGVGMDASAVVITHEELSYADPAFCLAYLAHSLLLVNNLQVNANNEQKQRLLPDLCSGAKIGGMCMSEPGAGTDVLGMQSTATQCDGGWRLTGNKLWITNGTLDGQSTGDVFLVYAKTGENRNQITQFVVEKGMDGFALGQKIHDKLGMRASMTAELVFDNVFVPSDNVVGQVHGATLCMMRNLEIERLGLAAMALGIARRCLNEMKDYACQRKSFGKELLAFGQIQRHAAESYAELMAGRSYVYAVANQLNLKGYGHGMDADGTKLFCANMAKQVADRAIQVMGGYGYVGEYKVERLWRDAKLLEIGGGTNESHHKNMARDLRKMGSTPIE